MRTNAVCWGRRLRSETVDFYIIAAGTLGIIRIIDYATVSLKKSLEGHTSGVTDLQISSREPSLLLSVSQDSVQNFRCLQKVNNNDPGFDFFPSSADFHCSNRWIVSCGGEAGVRVWFFKEGKFGAWSSGWLTKRRTEKLLSSYGARPQRFNGLQQHHHLDFV